MPATGFNHILETYYNYKVDVLKINHLNPLGYPIIHDLYIMDDVLIKEGQREHWIEHEIKLWIDFKTVIILDDTVTAKSKKINFLWGVEEDDTPTYLFNDWSTGNFGKIDE